MSISTKVLLAVLVVVTCSQFIECKTWDTKSFRGYFGPLEADAWIMFSDICFSHDAEIEFNVTWTGYSTDDSHVVVALYDDEASSYPAVSKRVGHDSCMKLINGSKRWYMMENNRTHIQPLHDPRHNHHWYFVVANCGGKTTDFSYHISYTGAFCGGSESGAAAAVTIVILLLVGGIVVGVVYFLQKKKREEKEKASFAQSWQNQAQRPPQKYQQLDDL